MTIELASILFTIVTSAVGVSWFLASKFARLEAKFDANTNVIVDMKVEVAEIRSKSYSNGERLAKLETASGH